MTASIVIIIIVILLPLKLHQTSFLVLSELTLIPVERVRRLLNSLPTDECGGWCLKLSGGGGGRGHQQAQKVTMTTL